MFFMASTEIHNLQKQWYSIVHELFLKQVKQGVGLLHRVEEIDLRGRLGLRHRDSYKKTIP